MPLCAPIKLPSHPRWLLSSWCQTCHCAKASKAQTDGDIAQTNTGDHYALAWPQQLIMLNHASNVVYANTKHSVANAHRDTQT
eukprot:7932925-Alexandrium_andersonii.AAC.2